MSKNISLCNMKKSRIYCYIIINQFIYIKTYFLVHKAEDLFDWGLYFVSKNIEKYISFLKVYISVFPPELE